MATVRLRKDETLDSLLRRFKRKVEKEGIIAEMRAKEYYVSNSEQRRIEKDKAIRNAKKKAMKAVSKSSY